MADEENKPEEEGAKPAEGGGEGEGGDDAAAWEAALSGEAQGEPSRILNQNEIDSLLGFSNKEDSGKESGIQAILDRALNTYERLPMLEVVFDRLVRTLSTSLRNFTSDNVDVSIDSMTSLRFGEYLNSIPLPALLVVFKAVEWENFGLITVDGSLIYSVVDVLLGGRRSNRPIRIEGRPYTTIEQEMVKRLVDILLSDMGAAFDPLSPATFQFDRLETNPRFATIARPENAAILIRLRVDMEERGGNIEILFPYATLEPIRDLLLQMFMGEKFGHDSAWERSLSEEIKGTHLVLEAVLDQKMLSLHEVANLKIGNTILLDTSPEEDITLKCGEMEIVKGKVGRKGERVAVKVSEMLVETKTHS